MIYVSVSLNEICQLRADTEFKTARIDEYREEVRELKQAHAKEVSLLRWQIQLERESKKDAIIQRAGMAALGLLTRQEQEQELELRQPLPPVTDEDWERMVRSVERMKQENSQ